jgi:hypothetical protein
MLNVAHLGLPDHKLLEQILPVLDIDRLAAGELALDRALERGELLGRLPLEHAGKLGLDGLLRAGLLLLPLLPHALLRLPVFEGRGAHQNHGAPELEVVRVLLERKVHLDVLLELLRLFQVDVLQAKKREEGR